MEDNVELSYNYSIKYFKVRGNFMMKLNTKWDIFEILPYEYEALELYLENKSLKGWELQSIHGVLLKFKRIEPRRIKYHVDIMDSISVWDGKNSEKSLEYRENYKSLGWQFVCEAGKIQIYSNESNTENIQSYINERERVKNAFKASLKYTFLKLITLSMLLIAQYMITIGRSDAKFLSSNVQLVSLVIVSLYTIEEVVGGIGFINWIIDRNRYIDKKRNKSNNYFRITSIKRTMNKVTFILAIIFLLTSVIFSMEVSVFKIIIINLIILLSLHIMLNLISKINFKGKSMINKFAYIVIMSLGFLLINGVIYTQDIRNDKKLQSNIYPLTLSDFNDEYMNERELYVDEESSLLASNLYYSNKGRNIELDYELFESKYKWVIEYSTYKKLKWLKSLNTEYVEMETNMPKDIRVYAPRNKGKYIIISPNKILEVFNWSNTLNESQLLDTVYEKIFKY